VLVRQTILDVVKRYASDEFRYATMRDPSGAPRAACRGTGPGMIATTSG
jgi:hypothetical protein